MHINGTIAKYNKYNLKTGEAEVILCLHNNRRISVKGVFPRLPKGTPVTTEIDDNNIAIKELRLLDDRELLKNFLTSPYFKSIKTPEQADKIITKTNGRVIEYIKSTTEDRFLAAKPSVGTKQLPVNTQKSVYRKLREIYFYIDIFNKVIKIGGDAESAKKLFSDKGENAFKEINVNPYILSYYGAPFAVCEKLAKERKIHSCDIRRTMAITEYAIKLNEKAGNTGIEFYDLCRLIHRIENNARCNYHTEELFILEAALRLKCAVEESENGEITIYGARMHEAERIISTEIKRLCTSSSKKRPLSEKEIKEIEIAENIKYSAKQKETFSVLSSTGLKIITGGPGTGKTTILRGLIQGFKMRSQGNILLCSPTGRAAYRMEELTGQKASTIHRLLKIDPTDKNSLYSKRIQGVRLCVVDESSMLDTELFARLLTALPSDTTVILMGDSDQLPSVEPGNIFSDLVECGQFEVHRLEQVYRQNNGSLVLENAKKTIQGDNNLRTGKQFIIKDLPIGSDLKSKLVEIVKKYCLSGGDMSKLTVFSPCRNPKYACSTENLNTAIKKEALNLDKGEIEYGPYSFSVKDRVVFTSNNYKKGYFNGMEGVISDIQLHSDDIRMAVDTEIGKIFLEEDDFADIELSYALTAHKAQGGECDYAIIMAPMEPVNMLLRKLFYVELTRAKKQVLILNEGNALDMMIKNGSEKKRKTGLIEAINSKLKENENSGKRNNN